MNVAAKGEKYGMSSKIIDKSPFTMRDELEFDGVVFTPAGRASETVGLSRDYIARLCKKGSITGRRVGSMWYVDLQSLQAFLEAQRHAREFRFKNLAQQRSKEYRANSSQESHATARVIPAREESNPATVELRQRLLHAFDETSERGMEAVSETSTVPSGLAHAMFQSVPAQTLSHVPAYAVTPTVEVLHKALAFATTFFVVVAVFAFTAPSQTKYAFTMVGESVAFARSGGLRDSIESSVHSGQTLMTIALSKIPRPAAGLSGAGASVTVDVRIGTAVPQNIATMQDQSHLASAGQAAAVAASLPQSGTVPNSLPVPAQENSIATKIPFTGSNVSYGDIIAYNGSTGMYTLSQGSNDPNAYGVAVADPALLFSPSSGGDVPLLHSGTALVNVTLENGPIAVGDQLTSSIIPGKARRANPGEHIIGVAAEAFTGLGGVLLRAPDGTQVPSGTISVDVNVGTAEASAPSASLASCTSLACMLLHAIDPALARAIARYLLAALIATLALYFAFKSFMSEANYGVISMGRNPLAKTSIQSMVLFNAVLAFVVASAGLFASLAILFAAP